MVDVEWKILAAFAYLATFGLIIFEIARSKTNGLKNRMPQDGLREIERQLRRQTDIAERDRWDRLNNIKQGR